MTKFDPQRYAKWQRWLKQIESELIHLLGSRKIYRSYGEIVTNNKQIMDEGAAFHNWLVDNYVTFVAMSIRRQNDADNDVVSLARLMIDIRDNPESLARDKHVAMYQDSTFMSAKDWGNRVFSEHAGKGEFIDPAIPERDLGGLNKVSAKIKLLADRSIAHKTNKEIPKLTFNEVDDCIESMKTIARKYIVLFSAGDNVLEPTMDDWQSIFTKKWVNGGGTNSFD